MKYTCPNGCGASKPEHICFSDNDNAQERAMRLRIRQLEQVVTTSVVCDKVREQA